MPGNAETLFDPLGYRLHQAHQGGDARHRQHDEERDAEQLSTRHLGKRHRQGLEDQARARRRIEAIVKDRREHHQPGGWR